MEKHPPHLLWGTYTWILLHWMSEQIKDSYFHSEKDQLLIFIKDICNNLPCPNCREHAVQYLSRIPLSMVKTKEELKYYIYHFHNSVNMRSKKQYEHHSILNKYKTINFKLLVDSWNHHFSYTNDIQRHDFMAKQRISQLKAKIITYFNENSYKFLMS
jgi:hypothetical protein